MKSLTTCLFALLLLAHASQSSADATTAPSTAPAKPLQFVITFPKAVLDAPFTGRAVVWLSEDNEQPRHGPNWFHPEPIYSAKFSNVAPGATMVIDNTNAVGFPGSLAELKAGDWIVQAVLDRNLGGRTIGESAGNLYSKSIHVKIDGTNGGKVELTCDQVVASRTPTDGESMKFVKLRSKLLSDFYHRDTFVNAAVMLPQSATKETKFPTIYSVPGFGGGDVSMMNGSRIRQMPSVDGIPFIRVALDPNCPTGHSVFADSDNNGPWGAALTTELIPEIEKRFPAIPRAEARFVTGHSSGGWSSLWLQVTYPTVFGGCWSTSPDPVDFRDFQQIDLYKLNQNLFTDDQGQPRPLARQGGKPTIFYKQFTLMERPIRGEQIGSFEAVFGGIGPDGEPAQLYNRDTGAIDPRVVEQWKRYDIGRILREHWNELAPNLSGKVHVYMGDIDTFYLDGAVRLLQADMKKLNADATIELVPGDHGSMMTRALRDRINKEMAEQFRKHATADELKAVDEHQANEPAATQPTKKAA